jgi:hypothetical protein
MNQRIGIALAISVCMHAAAMAVSFTFPHSLNNRQAGESTASVLALNIVDAALPIPDAASVFSGSKSDAFIKLEKAAAQTIASAQFDDIATLIANTSAQQSDAAASKAKVHESSAAGSVRANANLKSTLLTSLRFDSEFYPPNGGKLRVRIDIDESGMPTAVTKISQEPKDFVATHFLDMLLEARFIPAEKDGILVSNSIVIDLNLSLEQDSVALQFVRRK